MFRRGAKASWPGGSRWGTLQVHAFRMSPPRQDLYVIAAVALLLALFVGFGVYAVHATARLRRDESQVLERNYADTQQLLRIQQDAFQLAELVRDMVLTTPAPAPPEPVQRLAPLAQPPFAIWGLEFRRLRLDLEAALQQEARLAPAARGTTGRGDLERQLAQFWSVSDQVFRLARLGYPQAARDLVERELMPQRRVINDLVASWLREDRRQQEQVQALIEAAPGRIGRNFLWFTLLSLALGAIFSFWAIRFNRRAFRRIEALARDLHAAGGRLLVVQEEALGRLSRDLHDEFGQLLVAAGANLARAAALAGAATPAALEIASARDALQEAQGKMRDLVRALRPALLDDFGLERALAHAVGQFAAQTGLEARFESSGTLPVLPPERAVHLYRIAQESLTNAARHAGAGAVTVMLRAEGGRLTLSIRDNGKGFTPGASTAGTGLRGMRQRAEFLGGRLVVESGAGGTLVSAEVPCEASYTTAHG